jgi:predicted transcriptional regulator
VRESVNMGAAGMQGGDACCIPATYIMTTLEQVHVLADALRCRILDLLAQQAMTVTQLGTTLGTSRAKMLYHVRELQRVGLVELVEIRPGPPCRRKYYRAVAHSLVIALDLFRLPTASLTPSTRSLIP